MAGPGQEESGFPASGALSACGLSDADDGTAIPVHVVPTHGFAAWLASAAPGDRAWLSRLGFQAADLAVAQMPSGVVLTLAEDDWFAAGAALADRLPAGLYAGPHLQAAAAQDFTDGWCYGTYRFHGITQGGDGGIAAPTLLCAEGVDRTRILAWAAAERLMRDLTNMPRSQLGPDTLEAAVRAEADRYGARISVLAGEALRAAGFGLIHAVGRGGDEAPRLIELSWGEPDAPEITLVGKGVTFDAGGLNAKAWPDMIGMHMDMAGAASALALGIVIMRLQPGVRLRILLPVADNVPDGRAYRPSDVLISRSGRTVEIVHTDSEGRLLLADALWEGCRTHPRLIVDIATLTGARLLALGYETAAFFCNDEAIAAGLSQAASAGREALVRLPLLRHERPRLASDSADIRHRTERPDAQTILAALFLGEFVAPDVAWVHLDLAAWREHARPGRRRGAEPQMLRPLYALIEQLAAGGSPARKTAPHAARIGVGP